MNEVARRILAYNLVGDCYDMDSRLTLGDCWAKCKSALRRLFSFIA